MLPSIRKYGQYSLGVLNRSLTFKIETKYNLHTKVVSYVRRFYPEVILIPGLGELQETKDKRISSWRKGYKGGQPDLIISNFHKHYRGFCIEFKTPRGTGILSENQKNQLKQYELNGYKTLVRCNYDVIIRAIEHCKDLRIPCLYCSKKILIRITLNIHLIWIHKIFD